MSTLASSVGLSRGGVGAAAVQVLFVAVNLLLCGLLCGSLPLLVVYLAIGYLLVLHAAGGRARGGALSTALTLAVWIAVWLWFKPAPEPAPSPPIPGTLRWLDVGETLERLRAPSMLGASFLFLKVYDLIRRAQRGAPPPGLLAYLLQMAFVPSFASGPVAGPEPFLRGFAPTRATTAGGMNRIFIALFKAFVLAPFLQNTNLLAMGPDPIPGTAASALEVAMAMTRAELWLGLYASALWLYFNFSGFTDLAIGLGLLCGIRLPENFDRPYLAASPSEFWQRWHMSLTTWLREHVLAPVSRGLLRLRAGGELAAVLSTSAVMVTCGLWHRATLPFVVWGLYHAALVAAHQLYATRIKPRLAAAGLGAFFAGRLYRVLAVATTFHLIALGLALFFPLNAPLEDHLRIFARLVLPW